MICSRHRAICPGRSTTSYSEKRSSTSTKINQSISNPRQMAKQKRKSNKVLYWLIGAAVGILIMLFISRSMGWIGAPKEIEVEFAKVKYTTITEKVRASGAVKPVTEVKLAAEVWGETIK